MILSGNCDDIEAMVVHALGAALLSKELLTLHLESGHFMLVLDGVSESSLTPARLDQFIRGTTGTKTAVLLSGWPVQAVHDAIAKVSQSVIVEPLLLDEDSLVAFIRKYGEDSLSARLKQACGARGAYLPMLVRMAMRIERTAAVESVTDLYFSYILRTFESKLPKLTDRVTLLEKAARWCLETYWRDGHRVRAHNGAELTQDLLDAGLLVAADSHNPPVRIRFFHDSIQGFLTAYGLMIEDGGHYKTMPLIEGEVPDGGWTRELVFLRAAADGKFPASESNDDSGLSVGELFQMVLWCFSNLGEHRPDLRGWLREQLGDWADVAEASVSLLDLKNAVPRAFREKVSRRRGHAAVLRLAADLAYEADDADGKVDQLGVPFARVGRLFGECKIDGEESTSIVKNFQSIKRGMLAQAIGEGAVAREALS